MGVVLGWLPFSGEGAGVWLLLMALPPARWSRQHSRLPGASLLGCGDVQCLETCLAGT